MTEAARKIEKIRQLLAPSKLDGVRFRGVDWISWATCGASSIVLQTSETGIAEVFISQQHAMVLTNSIEADRLENEELSDDFQILAPRWPEASKEHRRWISENLGAAARIASDRPENEHPLPASFFEAKQELSAVEFERYRSLGEDAARALSEVLRRCDPDWSEFQLAGECARNLYALGIDPSLILVGGHPRLEQYRHPMPTFEKIGTTSMVVLCARRNGLFANFTRFVHFGEVPEALLKKLKVVASVEAAAFKAAQPHALLKDVFRAMSEAYARQGFSAEEFNHHQGGTTGYLSREVVATPDSLDKIPARAAIAFNPSIPGMKIEDTALLSDQGLEFITVDPAWPTFEFEGRKRPDILRR
jgi:Xaa-Pro aminopeptidase